MSVMLRYRSIAPILVPRTRIQWFSKTLEMCVCICVIEDASLTNLLQMTYKHSFCYRFSTSLGPKDQITFSYVMEDFLPKV